MSTRTSAGYLSGTSDATFRFDDLCSLLQRLGFDTRVKGSHHIFRWSKEDGAFVAEVPELPGCAAHGDSQATALANAQDAIALWIETAREFGDPIPEPKGHRLIFA